MRSNEIVQEGPLDFMGKAAAYAKGAMSQTQTGRGAWNVKAQEQKVAEIAKRDFGLWNKVESDLLGRQIPSAQIGKYLTNWARKAYEMPNLPAFTGTYTQQDALKYIGDAIRLRNTQEYEDQPQAQQPASGQQQTGQQTQQTQQPASGQQTGAQAAQTGQQTQQAQQPTAQQQDAALQNIKAKLPNMPDEEIKDNMANLQAKGKGPGDPMFDMYKAEVDKRAASGGQQPQAAGTEQPAAGQQPAADPAHALFKDPAAFKAEWDKFVASSPNYKLIADPELLSTLKNMWMRSGGTKVESKKNKGKRV